MDDGLPMGAAPAAVGAACALFAWCLTFWDVRLLMRRALVGAARVCRAAQAAARASAARFGLGAQGGGEPTLGDVSEMIDVVCLGLSAGLSFDAALGLYCEDGRGALAVPMSRARMSWQMGMVGREEALMEVARCARIRALESFAASVGQALALGAPLAETLASLGHECRAAHRAEVERQIERAPVKLLIPTGTLILPALLLSILGPLLAAGGMV